MSSPAPPGPSLTWVSADLNLEVSGRIVSHPEPGTVEGLMLELDERGIEIKHPSLVSVSTKPESQTLFSINTGEPLLTLATPLLPSTPPSDESSAIADDDETSPSPSPSRRRGNSSSTPASTSASSSAKPTLVTLHNALLPSSSIPELQSSPLFSPTFQILIDGPSFPPPHFDPSSIVPPTPLVKPYTFDPSNPPSSASQAAFAGGVLNSPTLQRALLSPLLSPQRRPSALGGSASGTGGSSDIPPLNLGLSRTSRASFSAQGERPGVVQKQPHGLAALVPSLSVAPSLSSEALSGTLTSALSAQAKKAAEEILALRRSHDLFVRRAKAELEVLEKRVEAFRAAGNGKNEEGVVRGFRAKDGGGEGETSSSSAASAGVPASASAAASAGNASQSRSPSRGRGRSPARVASSSRGRSTDRIKATDMDESLSSRIRAADEREEEERGRSRSRMGRRGSEGLGGVGAEGTRSRSRTKGVAEATRRAVEGAREKSASRERGSGGNVGGGGAAENGRGRAAEEGRGTPRKGESIPATLEEVDEADEGASSPAAPASSSFRASPAPPSPQPSSGNNGNHLPLPPLPAQTRSGATPTFIPQSSKALVAVPEEEELSLPPSRAESRTRIDRGERRERERTATAGSEDSNDQLFDGFQMDEDVDVEELDLSNPLAVPPRPQRLQQKQKTGHRSPATIELEGDVSVSPVVAPHVQSSSSFKPGSFQRASALSASYAALLSSSVSRSGAPASPSLTTASASALPASLGSPATASRAADGLPPFSPPNAHAPPTTSVREDAQNALSASILERTSGAGTENGRAKTPGPDPRDVRRGEQKIRDVLAMDVPSHRPLAGGRRASVGHTYTPDADSADNDDDGMSDNGSEAGDRVDDLQTSIASLRSPPGGTQTSGSSKFQVGSLPIALGRPSTVNAALSSWRPDPERLWAQEREKELRRAGGAAAAGAERTGAFSYAPPAAPPAAAQRKPQASSAGWSGASQPLEIGSPAGAATSSRRASVAAGAGASSSLAQSLRAGPASFSARAEAEQRFSRSRAAHRIGAGEPQGADELREEGGEGEDGEGEEDEEDEGTFVPPHLLGRRERGDERYLSRSVART
ncbi:hypothetical protein JCM10213_007750 [Rhodosporidiobolus nylandii]